MIDAYNKATKVATSVKSLDLSANSYQTGKGIIKVLSKYIDDLAKFQGNVTWGKDSVGAVSQRVLNVAIPDLVQTGEQSRALAEAVALANQNGVQLIFTTVTY